MHRAARPLSQGHEHLLRSARRPPRRGARGRGRGRRGLRGARSVSGTRRLLVSRAGATALPCCSPRLADGGDDALAVRDLCLVLDQLRHALLMQPMVLQQELRQGDSVQGHAGVGPNEAFRVRQEPLDSVALAFGEPPVQLSAVRRGVLLAVLFVPLLLLRHVVGANGGRGGWRAVTAAVIATAAAARGPSPGQLLLLLRQEERVQSAVERRGARGGVAGRLLGAGRRRRGGGAVAPVPLASRDGMQEGVLGVDDRRHLTHTALHPVLHGSAQCSFRCRDETAVASAGAARRNRAKMA
mmetsp:Transcript_121486/g.378124  ORF Transcript_121486/g.378124 Transcript_121486/m.378124 type:complete len:298 (-) Transcript_121486:3-896(-)